MPRVTITVPDKTAQPYRFQLDREVVTLGRGSENDIAIDSGSVSVTHAEMHRIEGGYELRDTGSTNGIKLDGNRYETIPLRNGKNVHIGDVAFDFVLSDEEIEILAREKQSSLPPLASAAPASPAAKPAPRPASYAPAKSDGGGGVGAMLLFFVLAALAFFAGLSIRHQKETGGSLLDAIKFKYAAKAPAVVPTTPGAPAAPALVAPEPVPIPAVPEAAPAPAPVAPPEATPAPEPGQ